MIFSDRNDKEDARQPHLLHILSAWVPESDGNNVRAVMRAVMWMWSTSMCWWRNYDSRIPRLSMTIMTEMTENFLPILLL